MDGDGVPNPARARPQVAEPAHFFTAAPHHNDHSSNVASDLR